MQEVALAARVARDKLFIVLISLRFLSFSSRLFSLFYLPAFSNLHRRTGAKHLAKNFSPGTIDGGGGGGEGGELRLNQQKTHSDAFCMNFQISPQLEALLHLLFFLTGLFVYYTVVLSKYW